MTGTREQSRVASRRPASGQRSTASTSSPATADARPRPVVAAARSASRSPCTPGRRRSRHAGPAPARASPVARPRCSSWPTTDGVEHLVLVSSAMVYGAWANNPVPLTEDAALRPDIEFAYARQLATVEQMVDDWRTQRAGPHRDGAAPGRRDGRRRHQRLARALAAGMGQRSGEDDPPRAVPAPRRPRRRGRARRPSSRWTACSTSPRRLGAGRAGARPVGRGAADQAARPAGRGGQLAALAVPARADPAGPAQLHPVAVAGGQRSAEGARAGSPR